MTLYSSVNERVARQKHKRSEMQRLTRQSRNRNPHLTTPSVTEQETAEVKQTFEDRNQSSICNQKQCTPNTRSSSGSKGSVRRRRTGAMQLPPAAAVVQREMWRRYAVSTAVVLAVAVPFFMWYKSMVAPTQRVARSRRIDRTSDGEL